MKKAMMVLVTAAMAATVMADVPSKNVVGFDTAGMTATEWKQQAMQFQKVGGGTNKLEDLPINPATWDLTEIQIAYIDGNGNVQFNGYTCYASDPNFGSGPAGWYDGAYQYVGDTVEIPTGTGFWLIPSTSGDIEYAGEVMTNDVQVSLTATEWKMMCVPYPVATMLEDLPITPATWDLTEMQIAYIDGNGNVQFNGYTCYASDPNFGSGPAGWYDGAYQYVGDSVEIPVGQGFWLIPSSTGSITFTSPL